MGEEKEQPKVDVKPRFRGNRRTNNRNKPSQRSAPFKAETTGLEDYVIKSGSTKDSADFETTIEKLWYFLETDIKQGGEMAKKAMKTLRDPVFVEPVPLSYNYQELGHHASKCPKLTDVEKKKIADMKKEPQGVANINIHDDDVEAAYEDMIADDDEVAGVAHMNIGGGDDESIYTVDSVIDGVGFVQPASVIGGVGFAQPGSQAGNRFECDRNKLYLDTCASHHSMFASEYLHSVRKSKVALRQNCNAGSKVANRIGKWRDFLFWENKGGIANLLSVPKLQKDGYQVTIKTGEPVSIASPDGRQIIVFKTAPGVCDGMPFIDLDKPEEHFFHVESSPLFVEMAELEIRKLAEAGVFAGVSTKMACTDVHEKQEQEAHLKARAAAGGGGVQDSAVFIETVRKNYEGFTKEQVLRATAARNAMAMMAHPRQDKMAEIVGSNVVTNCPFNAADLANSKIIFGPDRGSIKGKTVRTRPSAVRPEYTTIPRDLFERLQNVTLSADVMFVNGIPFLITQSRAIKLVTVEFLPSRTVDQLRLKLERAMRIYRRGGFVIRELLMDMEFTPLEDAVESVQVNTTAAREHVGDIERCIRAVKERARASVGQLPYKHCMPDAMVIELIYFVTMWMNAVLSDSGASTKFSPREIVTGLKMDFKKHCRAIWGSYIEAHDDPDQTNTMDSRTSPCIYLGTSGNAQGSVKCYNLETKKIIKRRNFTALPMPDRVVRRVIALGKTAKQQRKDKVSLQFLNRNKDKFDWDNDELDDIEPLIQKDTVDMRAELPGVLLESDLPADSPLESDMPTDRDLAAAAAQNAGLLPPLQVPETTGVDDEGPTTGNNDLSNYPNYVSDEEQDDDDGEDDGDSDGEPDEEPDAGDVDIIEPPEANHETIDVDEGQDQDGTAFEHVGDADDAENTAGAVADADDIESAADSDEDDADSITPVVRRSRRKRKKRPPMQVDFNNKAWKYDEGVVHINPAALEQAEETFKVVEPETAQRFGVISPRTAGITDEAMRAVTGLKRSEGIKEVTDGVVFHALGVILATQYSVNKGIKLFGDRAKESIGKELRQLHDYATYTPVSEDELTEKQKKEALSSLMFLTEKRCGRIKARACVNGSPQRDYIKKEDAASPTVMLDSVMITSAIDAHEGRKVVTCDIPGAFLHAELNEEVVMVLRGQLADLMVQVEPELYGPYVKKTKKGESLLYVRMLKAMYGLLRSALLFYLKLVQDLQSYGFELNPYDPCVANKMIGDKQLTVTWHVDDLKMSCVDEIEITKLLVYLGGKYGEKIVVHKGDVHDYLGIDMDFSENGVVQLSMMKHLQKVFEDFPEEIGKSAATPASDHLFVVRDPAENDREGKWLSKERAIAFHHSVAQMLFISGRVRRDVQTTVAFLTTRVKKPDEDDWGKLKRMLRYLKGTRHMKLRLSVNDLSTIRWWVDASYNVHEDCRGQTGAMMSLGDGAAISSSRKQKLNVRSSCEGELVGIDDALPTILWTRYFIEGQGYSIEQNILYQDNKSTILLANNGRWSSSKRTKHIKSRYFYIKDKVDLGEVQIEYRPTTEMWCDVLTKPKQGMGYKKDRAMIMNCEVEYDDDRERAMTNSALLPNSTSEATMDAKPMKPNNDKHPGHHCRSVLRKGENRVPGNSSVTWHTSVNRVDRSSHKARERHLEVVMARIRRARMMRERAAAHAARGRE